MITKNKLIATLIVLQVFTHGFYFFQVRGALQSEATCQLSRITQTTAMVKMLTDLNAEVKLIDKVKAKTKYRAKTVVNK